MSSLVAGSKLPSMAGTMTMSMLGVPSYMPQLGISPQNFSTPLFGAALSERSVPSVRFTRKVSTEPIAAWPSSSITVVSDATWSAPRAPASIRPMLLPWLDSPPRNSSVLPL